MGETGKWAHEGGRSRSISAELPIHTTHMFALRIHLNYLTTTLPGKYDAFETALEILRVKALLPNALPFEYSDLDKDFATFMACGTGGIEAQEARSSDRAEADRPVSFGEADGEERGGEVLGMLSIRTDDGEGAGGADALEAQWQHHPENLGASAEDIDRGQQRGDGIRSPSIRSLPPPSSLCGISAFETPGETCARQCGLGSRGKRASQVSLSHGVPGGAICCGHKGGLASCPRAWE